MELQEKSGLAAVLGNDMYLGGIDVWSHSQVFMKGARYEVQSQKLCPKVR